MGGCGSGSWYRWNSKSTTGDLCNLRMSYLTGEGIIAPGVWRSGSMYWSWNGERRSSIGYESRIQDDGASYFRVHYTNKNTGEDFDYKIRLTTTRPYYGGVRWWFLCPCCSNSRRVSVLYLGSKYFACRHCYNLAYPTQNESPHSRLLTKAQKIHRKLGGEGVVGWVPKPKGMHWKTYERRMQEMNYCHNISLGLVAEKWGFA